MTIKEVEQRTGLPRSVVRFYEKEGLIAPRRGGENGYRDYQEEDLRWLELALCMRKAGLPVEAMIEYLRLYQEGDETIPARLELLKNQMELLKKQKEQLEATMSHLSYKISRYEEAMKTGTLSWDDDRKCPLADVIGVTESGKSPSTASIANICFLI